MTAILANIPGTDPTAPLGLVGLILLFIVAAIFNKQREANFWRDVQRRRSQEFSAPPVQQPIEPLFLIKRRQDGQYARRYDFQTDGYEFSADRSWAYVFRGKEANEFLLKYDQGGSDGYDLEPYYRRG